jgi:hypothetical protein
VKFRKRKCSVISVNNRKEHHGEEKVLAIDVKMKVTGTSKLLDDFDPTLRKSFFRSDEPGQENMPRHPAIKSFDWGREFKDASIVLGENEYDEVSLGSFQFSCREGGVVDVIFTASWCPDADDVGPLAELIKEDTNVSFTTQFDLVDEASPGAPSSTTRTRSA